MKNASPSFFLSSTNGFEFPHPLYNVRQVVAKYVCAPENFL
jgi:hypothetical protein